MKKTLATLFIITLLISSLSAQENQVRYEKTAEDVLRWHELAERMRTSTQPPATVYSIAEFERMQSVLIAYPNYYGFGIPYTLISQLSDMANVIVAVSSSSQQNTVRNKLQQNGVNMNNVSFVIGSVDSYWTRDFGPWFILDGNNEFGVADFTYNRPSRPNDDAHMAIMANHLDINHFDFPIVHTGGNYMSDGYGTAASDELIIDENDDLTEAQIRQYCYDYLGIDNYHITIDPQGDYIAHIDCWGKFLGVDKILIAQLPVGAEHYQDYESVANYFENATTPWGNKYKVYRVFEPGSTVSNARTPYTNSLILNDHVFVPITGTSYDADALDVYREAMPGYTIVGINELTSARWENTDALHCRTHEIPDFGMIRFHHFPTLGAREYDSTFTIRTDIKFLSQQNPVTDSVRIFYRIKNESETTAWTSTAMTHVGGEIWEGDITGIADTCEVQYYLFAKDESGRREFYPLIGEPDPFVFTVASNPNPGGGDIPTDTTTVDPGENDDDDTTHISINDFSLQSVSIIPNPAKDIVSIRCSWQNAQCTISNTNGQIIYRKNTNGDAPVKINVTNWPQGIYFVNIQDNIGHKITKKLIIQ